MDNPPLGRPPICQQSAAGAPLTLMGKIATRIRGFGRLAQTLAAEGEPSEMLSIVKSSSGQKWSAVSRIPRPEMLSNVVISRVCLPEPWRREASITKMLANVSFCTGSTFPDPEPLLNLTVSTGSATRNARISGLFRSGGCAWPASDRAESARDPAVRSTRSMSRYAKPAGPPATTGQKGRTTG